MIVYRLQIHQSVGFANHSSYARIYFDIDCGLAMGAYGDSYGEAPFTSQECAAGQVHGVGSGINGRPKATVRI